MKKLLLSLLVCTVLQAKAETHVVTISSFQFSPANLNVVVGDVIRWEWTAGSHNTASVTIPSAAAPWSSPISGAGFSFEYTVTAPGVYDYQCEPHAGFMMGSFTASGTVPVTLSAFNISTQSRKPYLSWTTQTESNSDYFSVRRSYDGKVFTEIGRVPAAGQSSGIQHYSFADIDVRSNNRYVYYELRITDRDGKYQLSPIKLFKNNEAVKKMITSISPNPVTSAGHLIIQFNADEKTMLQAKVMDITGKQVLITQLSASAGVNNGHIHLGDLAAGNYVVQFTMNGKTETHKISKK